jgi:GNAT superfamily N-acetyltransferase
MLTFIRTNSENKNFKKLIKLLNTDLAKRDGENHPLAQFNNIDNIKNVVLVFKENFPIGCGAITNYSVNKMEIKRMYVLPNFRNEKIGSKILNELEKWAKELGCKKCLLFTGINQPEANILYKNNGYQQIQKYGKLAEIKDSICFAKII